MLNTPDILNEHLREVNWYNNNFKYNVTELENKILEIYVQTTAGMKNKTNQNTIPNKN